MPTELSDIDGVGPSTKDKLNEVGIDTVNELAQASVGDVTEVGVSNSRAEEFIEEAKQSTVLIKDTFEVEEENNNKDCVTTGIDKVDEAFEGGLYEQQIISVYGGPSTGKSQLCYKLLVEAVKETDKVGIYIETEPSRFLPSRIKSLADNDEDVLENIKRIEAHDLETQENSFGKIAKEFDDVAIVIVDSLTARIRLSDQFDGRGDLKSRSSLLGRHLTKMEEMGRQLSCPVVFTNQVYGNPKGFGKGEIQYGGKLLQHVSFASLHMTEAQGELKSLEIENHPSTGSTEMAIKISEQDINCVD